MTMRRITDIMPSTFSRLFLAASIALVAACGDDDADAYGHFEATEVMVSAEVGGQLLRLDLAEGQRLARGAVVGAIDSTTLVLRRNELEAQRAAARTRTTETSAQLAALQAQLVTAEEEHQRARRLFNVEAGTAQQLTRAEGEVRVLRQRIEAARAQVAAVRQEIGGIEARIDQVDDEIRRSTIVNPRAGTVLATYVERGELVQPGQPLYKIADLDTLTLRAYVSGAQLARVRIGAPVRVLVDAGEDEVATLEGLVSWVAASAEFTPTPIQTREERTDQVYAVKIRVANPRGLLKIGMPGEVILDAPPPSEPPADVGRDAPRPVVP